MPCAILVTAKNCQVVPMDDQHHGTISVTTSGYVCQRWDSQSTYTNFPVDATIADAANYCRNPDNDVGGPWCLVDSSSYPKSWEYCTLPPPVCDCESP